MNSNTDIILERIENIKTDIQDLSCKFQEHKKYTEERLRALEDWRLVFVAKFSVYSALAIFCGTVVAQLGLGLLFNKLW